MANKADTKSDFEKGPIYEKHKKHRDYHFYFITSEPSKWDKKKK